MANIYRAKLDVKSVRPDFNPKFTQYDHARLEIKLTDAGQPYDLSNVERVEFTHVRADDEVIIHAGEIVESSGGLIVAYDYRGSEMDVLSEVKTSFALFDAEGKKVSSPVFSVDIEKDLRNDVFSPAEPNYGLLQTLIADVAYVKENSGSTTDYTELREIIADLSRRLLVLEGSPSTPGYERIVYGDVIDIKGHFAIALSDDNILMLSEDYGETYTKSIDVSSLGMIKMVHPFTDGTVLFCTDARAYTTEDFVTFTESATLDVSGNPFIPTTVDNFTIQCKDAKNQIVDGLEMLVWGNYAHQGDNMRGLAKLWYTVDKGKTLRLAYKFANTVADPEIYALHVHGVIYHPEDKSFWVLTGDHLTNGKHEAHFIKGLYNKTTNTWNWTVIGTGDKFKAGNMVFWEGYAYWSWDITPGGVVRCRYEDIADVSKHELLLSTPNDCLDIVMSTRGEIIATQTMWGSNDAPRNFYYSADRVNFQRIEGELPEGSEQMAMYNVIRINGANQVIGGVFNPIPGMELKDWNLKPSIYLDKMVRNAGFKDAFLSPSIVVDPLNPLAPILHYDFRGKTNANANRTIIEDLSASNADGTLTNFTFSGTSGYVADGLSFDNTSGNNVYAKVSDELFSEGTMTVYFKPSDLGDGTRDYYPSVITNLISYFDGVSNVTKGYTLDLLQQNMYLEYAYPNGVGTGYHACNQGVALNKWNHLTLTHKDGVFTIYYNGQQVLNNSSLATPMLPNIQEFVIGRYNIEQVKFPYTGVVGYVKAFDYALTPAQALAEYASREQLN